MIVHVSVRFADEQEDAKWQGVKMKFVATAKVPAKKNLLPMEGIDRVSSGNLAPGAEAQGKNTV